MAALPIDLYFGGVVSRVQPMVCVLVYSLLLVSSSSLVSLEVVPVRAVFPQLLA